MYVRLLQIVITIFLGISVSSAQELKINSGFVEDSLEVGEEVHFWITTQYPNYLEAIFPDSLYDFSPYEYVGKYYQPTSLKEGLLFDSAVYTLQSFEIESFQFLQLPIIILEEEDSISMMSPLDSIAYRDLVTLITDSTALITNSRYINVPLAFNYPMLWIVLGIVTFTAIITLVLFGKRIRAALHIRRLRKDYKKFNDRLTEQIKTLKTKPEVYLAEHALIDWKVFMEKLEKQPYSKLTTAEILEDKGNNEITDTLKSIDKMVYGRKASDTIYKCFQSIEDFTQYRYQLRINKLKDGGSTQQ